MSAYEVINGVNTNDGGRTLGATVVFEGIKVWKGQPFERADGKALLSGALVYLLQHDYYENARAAFQNSLFENSAKTPPRMDYDHIKSEESNFACAGLYRAGHLLFPPAQHGRSGDRSQDSSLTTRPSWNLRPRH